MSVAIEIELSEAVAARMRAVAERTGTPIEEFVRDAVMMHVADFEDALEALEVRKNPATEYVSTDELRRQLGLSGSVE